MKTLRVEKNLRLLVIDDTRAIHDDFRKILLAGGRGDRAFDAANAALFAEAGPSAAAAGFELDSAYQGQEGLELVIRALECGRPYATIFVDLRMPPGWDGIETIERIWRVAPDVQVVICTAYSDYTWDQLVARLGRSDRLLILKKPFDAMEVLQLASTLTEKWRLTQQARATIADLETMVQARSSELAAALEQLQGSLIERGRTEAALRASEEKFSRVFQLYPDAVSIHRLGDGTCVEINPAFTRITGYTADDTLNDEPLFLKWGFWKDPKDRERLQAELRLDGATSGVEGPLCRKDGGIIRCLVSARVMEIGGESCVLAITRDLTVQRRLETQLVQAMKMEAVGQLAGGVAHDYNNILTATLVQLGLMLERDNLAPEIRVGLQELERMAQRSASLTRQLLAFSRQQVMQRAPINLNDVLGTLFTMLRRLLGENIELEFHFAPAALMIDADIGMIEQLVTNLCVNARDAMLPRGGRLTIRTGLVVIDKLPSGACPEAYVGRFAFLSVADTGCGMDAATLTHAFEPFFTTKELGKGTGLGLATVYGITQQHRGWVEVESELGCGSLFRVMLPALSVAIKKPSSPAPSPAKRGRETILLVEDEEPVRVIVAMALQRCGYQVHEAADGKKAVEQWGERAHEIDLLFSDMMMPNGMTGLDLVEYFKRRNPNVRAILSSGYSVELSKMDTVRCNGVDFLPKPFTIGKLAELVRKCLDAEPTQTPAAVRNGSAT